MAPTEGRVARPERWWGYRRGTPEYMARSTKTVELGDQLIAATTKYIKRVWDVGKWIK